MPIAQMTGIRRLKHANRASVLHLPPFIYL